MKYIGNCNDAGNESVTLREATQLIRAGVGDAAGQTWADLGAGDGTFTRALATLVGNDGSIIALDHDDAAIRALRRISRDIPAPRIDVMEGDVTSLHLPDIPLDGALLANILHFIENPAEVLAQVRTYLRPHGRVLVIEYERRARSPWVPYPLPLSRLEEVARDAGYTTPVEVGRRKSRYQGELYCALLSLP